MVEHREAAKSRPAGRLWEGHLRPWRLDLSASRQTPAHAIRDHIGGCGLRELLRIMVNLTPKAAEDGRRVPPSGDGEATEETARERAVLRRSADTS